MVASIAVARQLVIRVSESRPLSKLLRMATRTIAYLEDSDTGVYAEVEDC